jgi:hypothetical protein
MKRSEEIVMVILSWLSKASIIITKVFHSRFQRVYQNPFRLKSLWLPAVDHEEFRGLKSRYKMACRMMVCSRLVKSHK